MKPLSNSEAALALVAKRRIVANSPLKAILAERLEEGLPPSRRPLSKTDKEALQRVRESKARLRAQGSPLAGKREAPDYLPTPQRMAKGELEEDIDPAWGRRYRPGPNIVEREKGKLGGDEVEWAFEQLIEDAFAMDVTNVTINYNSAGSRSSGSRLGGLGAAQADKLLRYHRYNAVLDKLTTRSRRIVEWVLFPRDSTHAPMSFEELGRWLAPYYKDPHALRMLGKGRFIGLGDELVKHYTEYNLETRVAELRVKDMRTISGGGR